MTWEHQRIREVIGMLLHEAHRADVKWGNDKRDGIVDDLWPVLENIRVAVDLKNKAGGATWVQVLTEEFLEVVTERDPEKLRIELAQLGAVCARWIHAIDRRTEESSVRGGSE